MREGSLEAPTRHPVNWKEKSFYDESLFFNELERVFDICHGCRRCVSLCTAFPTLFDLVDESSTMEVDGVDKKDYWKVVDKCYLCDMCYLSKCPYVPPHEWNVDFPHLMMRGKAIKFKKGESKVRDKVLSSTDFMGKTLAKPVISNVVNASNKNKIFRNLLDSTFKVHKHRDLPDYSAYTFRGKNNNTNTITDPISPSTVPSKVVLFTTCYVNYNEPIIGEDFLKVLNKNNIQHELLNSEVCCGMPKFELGDLESVEKLAMKNLPLLSKYANEGYAIISLVPSCTLMFKQEIPLLFADNQEFKKIAQQFYDPFSYLLALNKESLLSLDFKNDLGNISYHVPCHLRVQNIGLKTKELLELIPGTKVKTIERCSGHDGTWGIKTEFFKDSMKIGKPVFKAAEQFKPDYISSDCAIASRHIVQGVRENSKKNIEKLHPISLMRLAYNL